MTTAAAIPSLVEMPSLEAVGVRTAPSRRRRLGMVLAEAHMANVATLEFAGGNAVVYTTRSPQKETPNEDVAAFLPTGLASGVLVVADGLGGHAAGERASRLAVETLQKTLQAAVSLAPEGDADKIRGAILDGIEAANQNVRQLGSGAATTLALVEIQGHTVRPYHVGDSVILITGQRGKLKLQTIAHSPIGYAVEAGFMKEEDAIHHEARHVISNVIGSDQMRIEIGPPTEMAPRDTLLVASDGLVDNLLPTEIVEFIRSGPLDRGVAQMVAEAARRMATNSGSDPSKPDDLTVIAYRPS